jgi:hypothetical protein
MNYSIASLIAMTMQKQQFPDTKWNILYTHYDLNDSKCNRSFFDLIYYIKNNHSDINICLILDDIRCITASMNNNDAQEFVNIIINENYKIESILKKIINNDTLINIINNIDFVINYDCIFSDTLCSTLYNITIINYIMHNNLVDFNNFDLYECTSNITDCNYYRVIDTLLTKGVDISKFPINNNNVVRILWFISLSNLKYFSHIKIALSKYIMIVLTLECSKLEEFLNYYDTQNIIYDENTNVDTNCAQFNSCVKRAQLLLDSGINLDKVLSLLFKAINNHCECDCLSYCQ